MKYEQVIEIIENKRRFGNLPGITISKEMLAAVGNPEKELSFVHIAGTNGKGSTAAFLRTILTEAGIKTGMFTSPHLIDFTERIQVDGKQISKEDAARIGEYLLSMDWKVHPTMFDYCMVMAMLYFKEQGCEIVILETGLGGKMDSTNAIDAPLVSIITKIGYDHTAVLGNTLAKIASEKAGILKRGTRAVIESQETEALEILERRCRELEIPVQILKKDKITQKGETFSYPGEMPYHMQMQGIYQQENAVTAVLAARELQKLGYAVSEEALHLGVQHALWEGRMEIVSDHPFLMIDGAHNGHGVTALAESLKSLYPGEKFHFIMGVLADKDYEKMADTILPLAMDVITVTPESSRALQGECLAEYIRKQGISAKNSDYLFKVLEPFIKKTENDNEKTIAFGSLYFIGDIRKILKL